MCIDSEEADIRNEGTTEQEEPFRHCTGWLCYWSHVCHKNGEKCRATLFHAMKAYRSRGIAPLIRNPLNAELNPICYLLALLGAYHFLHVSRIRVNLRTRWRWVVNFTPRPLYPRENAGTHWLRSWVGPIADFDLLKKRRFIVPARIRTPNLSACVESLYRLRCSGSS